MAATITGISRVAPIVQASVTAAAVGPGDAAVANPGTRSGFKGSCLSLGQETAPTAGYLYTAWQNLSPSTYDISGDDQYMICHFRNEIPDYHQFPTSGADAAEAVAFILFSGGGSSNWAVWYMAYSPELVNGQWHPIVLGVTDPAATGGTWDNTDVTGYGVGSRVRNTEIYVMNSMFQQLIYVDGIPVFGDDSSAATEFQDYIDILSDHVNTTYSHKAIRQAGTTYEIGHSFNLTARNFNDTPEAVGIAIMDNDLGYSGIPNGTFKLNYTPPASGTQVLDNYAFASSGNKPNISINGTASSSAVTLNSCLLATANDVSVTGSGATLNSVTIPSPANLTVSAGDIDATATGVGAAIQWTSDLVAGSTITTNSDIDITFAGTNLDDINLVLTGALTISVDPTGASQTYYLGGIVTSSTLKLWNKDTSNATTIEIPAGITNQKIDLWFNYDGESGGPFTVGETLTFGNGATATLRTLTDNGATGTMYCTYIAGTTPPDNNSITGGTSSATALVNAASGASKSTLTIVQTPVTFTINSSESSSLIQIFTAGTQTVLASTTGSQLVYTHSNETVDYVVQKAGFIPQRFTSTTALSGTTSATVNLVPSREYDASHGLTYTTDASWNAKENTITGITKANPSVVTYSGTDNWSNGDVITITDVVGMTEVNNTRYTVANVNTGANTFELSGVNSTSYTTYVSGGIIGNGLTVPTFGVTGRGVYSLMIDSFISQTSLRNRPFNLQMDGYNSLFFVNGAEAATDASITKLVDCGVGYYSKTNTLLASWIGINSNGTIPGGATGEYQQVDGSGTTDARATGAFQELIKVYGDTNHGNFDYRGHLVAKYQINGYREERVDVLDTYGIAALEPTLYIVAMEPAAITAATGDPALTITITDHGASPVTWNGKQFAITITDNASPSSAENILRELNYNLSLDATYQGKDPFNWPEMAKELGDGYETIYGYTEGAQSTTLKGVRVVTNGGTDAHPGFTRFQSDDGTYYTPPTVSTISITGMPTAGGSIRLQIHNETAKTASAWTLSTAYAQYDKVLRTTGTGTESTAGRYFVATTAGTSAGTEPTWNTTVGATTTDGTVTWTCYSILFYDANPSSASYSDTYTDGEEFIDGDVYRIRFAELNGSTSFKTYETTGFVGSTGFTVAVNEDADSVYASNAIDGRSAAVTNIYTANYTTDYFVLDANLDFTNPKSYAFYCGELTTSEGMYNIWGAVTAIDAGNYLNDVTIADILFDETGGYVKQEVSDTSRWYRSDGTRPALDPTTGGNGIEINWKNPVYTIATGSVLTAGQQAQLTAIESKTNGLTFTVSNKVDANVHYMNDAEVQGDGSVGDKWRGV